MVAVANLVHETSSTTGTSDFTLSNVSGKQSFNDAFGTGGTDAFFYFISNRDASEWECGTGHLSASTTLVRDTVIDSSNSGSAVNFSVGTKDVTNDVPASNQTVLRGHIYGLTLSNNGTDASHDIDIAVGEASSDDSSPILMKLTSALTKQADATWAAGDAAGGSMDSGTMTADGTIHWWLISDASGSTVDVACSDHDTSGLSPTLPTGYTKKRRIGSLCLDGTSPGNFLTFSQTGHEFLHGTVAADVTNTNPGTSPLTPTLTVPAGVKVKAKLTFSFLDASASGARYFTIYSLDATQTASISAFLQRGVNFGGSNFAGTGQVEVLTNTAAQVGYDLSDSDADITVYIQTIGWYDQLGESA